MTPGERPELEGIRSGVERQLVESLLGLGLVDPGALRELLARRAPGDLRPLPALLQAAGVVSAADLEPLVATIRATATASASGRSRAVSTRLAKVDHLELAPGASRPTTPAGRATTARRRCASTRVRPGARDARSSSCEARRARPRDRGPRGDAAPVPERAAREARAARARGGAPLARVQRDPEAARIGLAHPVERVAPTRLTLQGPERRRAHDDRAERRSASHPRRYRAALVGHSTLQTVVGVSTLRSRSSDVGTT